MVNMPLIFWFDFLGYVAGWKCITEQHNYLLKKRLQTSVGTVYRWFHKIKYCVYPVMLLLNDRLFWSVWLDLRTQSTVERLINKTPGRNKNHLKVRYSNSSQFQTWICYLFTAVLSLTVVRSIKQASPSAHTSVLWSSAGWWTMYGRSMKLWCLDAPCLALSTPGSSGYESDGRFSVWT